MKAPYYLLGTVLLASSLSVLAEDKDFKMDGELGLIVTTGNTETSSVKGKINAHQELTNWSNDYTFETLFKKDEEINDLGEEESKTTEQKFFLSAQGNYKLENPDNRLFAFASYEDNRFSGFEYQATVAGGWNSQLWNDSSSRFSYSIGPGYSFADTTAGEDVSGFIVRAAVDYAWVISETAQFKQAISTEIGSDNTKSKSESAITAKISEALSLKFSIVLNHNSEVADGLKNLDTETSATIVYAFF